VLVNLRDGSVLTIDHADSFADVANLTEPVVSVTPIPSVQESVGKDEFSVKAAIAKIKAANDVVILEAVSRMPFGGAWQSPPDRRLQIARWLVYRRDRLEEVMERWRTS
jgi:hypothetical protein